MFCYHDDNLRSNDSNFFSKLVSLLKLSSWCLVTITVLWLFLTVPWVGLQCVIVVFPDHTHLFFLKMMVEQFPSNLRPVAVQSLSVR